MIEENEDDYEDDIYGENDEVLDANFELHQLQTQQRPQLSDLYAPRYVGACCDMTSHILNTSRIFSNISSVLEVLAQMKYINVTLYFLKI